MSTATTPARRATFAESSAAGAAIASASATLGLWLTSALLGRPNGVSEIAFLFVVALILATLWVFTFGLAWHLFAQARGWTGAAAYVLPGAFGGFLLSNALALFLMIWGEDEGAPKPAFLDLAGVVAYGIALGVITGFAFWLIRRPDRDAPNPAKPAP